MQKDYVDDIWSEKQELITVEVRKNVWIKLWLYKDCLIWTNILIPLKVIIFWTIIDAKHIRFY